MLPKNWDDLQRVSFLFGSMSRRSAIRGRFLGVPRSGSQGCGFAESVHLEGAHQLGKSSLGVRIPREPEGHGSIRNAPQSIQKRFLCWMFFCFFRGAQVHLSLSTKNNSVDLRKWQVPFGFPLAPSNLEPPYIETIRPLFPQNNGEVRVASDGNRLMLRANAVSGRRNRRDEEARGKRRERRQGKGGRYGGGKTGS